MAAARASGRGGATRGDPRGSDPSGHDARGTDPARRGGGNRALLRALAYLGAYRVPAVGAFLALLLVTAANLATPLLIQVAIDRGVTGRQTQVVLTAAGAIVAIALVRAVASFLQGYLAERASQGVAFDLRNAMFTRMQLLSFSYYDTVETGQLLTRLTNDVEQIRTFAGQGIVQLAAAGIMLVGSAALLFALNWRLALVALATIPLILLVLLRFLRTVAPLFAQVQQTLGQLNNVLREDLAGTRVIRAFTREDHELARYAAINDDLLRRNLQTIRALANNFPTIGFLANLGTLAIVAFGGLQVLRVIGGGLTIGGLIAFNAYLGFLIQPVLTVGFLAAAIPRAGASARRVFDVLDAPVDVRDAPDAVPLPPVDGRVTFANVHFRYPGSDREVLRGVSFDVAPGQTVAILGTTGSGKSTLVNLIPRFYDVTSGSVAIDGHDVRSVTLDSLRSQIAIVLQEALLFSGTVRDNIAYGRPDATWEEVAAAARAAQADEFIRALPDGYRTVIGERGVGLSGGQRQRIAIARALLVDRCLLILDDSTSAVDTATEAALQEALDRLIRDSQRTAFVIAQRISTVRDADLILVLDDGMIAARGTHEELLRDSPLYNEILGSQLRPDLAAVAGSPTVAGGPTVAGSGAEGGAL